MLFLAGITCTSAAASFTSNVHVLPAPPVNLKPMPCSKECRIEPYIAHDSSGHALNIPARIVGLFTGALFWDSPNPSKVPAFTLAVPQNLRDRIAIYYAKPVGWMVVPRGWILATAGEGADGGTGFEFIAPRTSSAPKTGQLGWMLVGLVPACVGCMYDEADGIIPGAHEAMIKLFPNLPEEPPRLVPKPEFIEYPDPCTATFRYSLPQSPPVQALVYFGPYQEEGDMFETNIYIAMPDSKSNLVDFIIKNFSKIARNCSVK